MKSWAQILESFSQLWPNSHPKSPNLVTHMSHSFPDRIIPTLASPSLVNKGANITPLTNPYLLPTMPTLNLVLLNGRLLSTFFFFFCSVLHHSLFHPNVLIWITDFLILIRCQHHWWPLTLSLPYSVPPSYQYPCWTLQCTVQSTWMQVQVHIPYSTRLYKI